MGATAGRWLASAVAVTALALSPALGYANTFVLLALGAGAVVWLVAAERVAPPSTAYGGPPPPQAGEDGAWHRRGLQGFSPVYGGGGPREAWWRGEQRAPALLFALAFLLITIAALGAMRQPSDLLAIVPYIAPLFFLPLARLFEGRDLDLPRLALIGAVVGLLTAVALRYGIGRPRAGEGSFITDPYRLAVTTLLCATLGLGALGTRERWRWVSILGLIAAVGTIWLTGSRTALLGVPVLLALTALCLVRRPPAIAAALAAAAALAGAALFVELPGTARLPLRDVVGSFARGDTIADESIRVRVELWGDGVREFLAAPWFGHGWGDWMMEPLRAGFPPDLESLPNIVHLHNDALHFAVAGGLPGLAAWALLLLAPLAGYAAQTREQRSRPRLHAVLVLSLGYLVLGLPDIMLASPTQLTLYVALTAAMLGTTTPHRRPLPGPPHEGEGEEGAR